MGTIVHHRIPERFLRQLWKHQLFDRTDLQIFDGRPVEIIAPGKLNPDSGPDFLGARVRIGGVLYAGNIELHRSVTEWRNHGHHRDPLYNRVILHVVLHTPPEHSVQRTKNRRGIPLLVLERYLRSSYHHLWSAMIERERAERTFTLPCAGNNGSGADSEKIQQWLRRLALERAELKIRRFDERLKELVTESRFRIAEPPSRYDDPPFGLNPEELPPPVPVYSQRDFAKLCLWEQLLYEGVLQALGFSKNQDPMRKLAQNLRLTTLRRAIAGKCDEEAVALAEALLFHASGLLSAPMTGFDQQSREQIRHYRTLVKEVHPVYLGETLHRTEWKFFRLRPENFPTLRIAGAARMFARLARQEMFREIIRDMKNESLSSAAIYKAIRALLLVPSEGFWNLHYRFGELGTSVIRHLVGPSRAEDIIINAVIPVCLLYARIFRDTALRRRILELFEQSPPTPANEILSSMEPHLLRHSVTIEGAFLQQGVMQLYKQYCMEQRCGECAFGTQAG
jgi:hypothetical protein